MEKERAFKIRQFEEGYKPPPYRIVTFGDIVRVEYQTREYAWWCPFVSKTVWKHVRFFPERSKASCWIREELDTYNKWKNGKVIA